MNINAIGTLNRRLIFTALFVSAFLIECICVMLQQSSIDFLNPPFALVLTTKIVICGCCLWYYVKDECYTRTSFLSATIVLILMLISMFRGLFAVEGYWGYKGWVNCVLSALSFTLIFPLFSPIIAGKLLQSWNKFIFPLFLFVGIWMVRFGSYPFQIPFIYYFYILLFTLAVSYPKARWIIISGTICTLIVLENRSAIIKTAIAIALCSTLYLPRVLAKISHITIHFFFYLLPIILFYLGITGTFNVFKVLTNDEPKTVVWNSTPSNDITDNKELTGDTRTFLYAEVLLSAIEGDYVIFGHSIGRGNTHGGEWTTDVEGMDSSERLMNEAEILNIFTWMGLVGVVLYTIMYLQASLLGLFFSKNRYIPLIACTVAFHWAMLWIEECPSFRPMDFALFLLLGMCFSPRFRRMSDGEFKLWFFSCFASPREHTPYDSLKRLKLYYLIKLLKARKNGKV